MPPIAPSASIPITPFGAPSPTLAAMIAQHSPVAFAFLLALAAQLAFSAKSIFVKLAYAAQPTLDPVTLSALRFAYAAPFMVALGLWWFRKNATRARAPLTRHDVLLATVVGGAGYYVQSYLNFVGLQWIDASLERLIFFTNPAIVVLLGVVFARQRFNRFVLCGLTLSYIGLCAVFLSKMNSSINQSHLLMGSALVVGAAFIYAVYILIGARIAVRIGGTRFTVIAMLAAAVCALLHFAATQPLAALNVGGEVRALAVALGVIGTALPVWMTAVALSRLGACTVASLGSIGPIYTLLLGVALLGETVSTAQLIGIALTLTGIAMVSVRTPSASGTHISAIWRK